MRARPPAWLTVTLAIALILVLMLNLWGLRPFGSGVIDYERFGDIGTWAQGIGTVLAVFVTLRQIRQQRDDRREAVEHQEIRERTQVYGWMAFRESSPEDLAGWYLFFNNLTPLPISAWAMTVRERRTDRVVLAPDVTGFDPVPPGFSRHRLDIPADRVSEPVCDLRFVDMAGDCWERSSLGRIASIPGVLLDGQVIGGRPAG